MPELQSRLSHLVNYSSQLIFVSGDSIADQQKALSDFLSSQQDNTDISFFSASTDKQASDYRGAICRQLGGHKVGSFIRPLQQLLSDPADGLTGTGPYLVCITQAEQLDNSFLQELWDWVMHAQQDNEELHLNVILFGESAWAKSSQEWLPIQNSHKPVLLSSESINPVGFDVNALEALMADKSSWFSTSNKPLVTNKWFIGGVLSVFLIVFVGLMAWQYPSQFSSFFGGNTNLKVNNDNVELDLLAKTNTMLDQQKVDTDSPIYKPQLELVESTRNDNLTSENKNKTVDEKAASITKTLLLLNWSDSLVVSDNTIDKANVIETVKGNTGTNDASVNATASVVNSDRTQAIQEKLTATIDEKGDFRVPDIISVEQLDAQLSIGPPVDFAVDAVVAEPEPISQTKVLQKEPPPSIIDKSSLDYQFDETTLLSLPKNSILLQLAGVQNLGVLENYLKSNNLKASTWVYETKRYGGSWHVVVYRQTFTSASAALKHLPNLPKNVRDGKPFAKSISQIRKEINRR